MATVSWVGTPEELAHVLQLLRQGTREHEPAGVLQGVRVHSDGFDVLSQVTKAGTFLDPHGVTFVYAPRPQGEPSDQ